MKAKNNISLGVAIAAGVIFSVYALSSFNGIKKMENGFSVKVSAITWGNRDLRERIDSMQKTLDEKKEYGGAIEREKQELMAFGDLLKKENERMFQSLKTQLDDRRQQNAVLRKRITSLKYSPIAQGSKIENTTEDAAGNKGPVNENKLVDLGPIVVKNIGKSFGADKERSDPPPVQGKNGFITKTDSKSNFIIIDLGSRDYVKEGDRLVILKDDHEIARAEVTSVRYRVASAVVDNITYGYRITDIKEGDRVTVLKR